MYPTTLELCVSFSRKKRSGLNFRAVVFKLQMGELSFVVYINGVGLEISM